MNPLFYQKKTHAKNNSQIYSFYFFEKKGQILKTAHRNVKIKVQ